MYYYIIYYGNDTRYLQSYIMFGILYNREIMYINNF